MENAVASMQRLTNDVLDLTKLQQGKLEIKPVHVRVPRCC